MESNEATPHGWHRVFINGQPHKEIWWIENGIVVDYHTVADFVATGYTFEPVVVLTKAEHDKLTGDLAWAKEEMDRLVHERDEARAAMMKATQDYLALMRNAPRHTQELHGSLQFQLERATRLQRELDEAKNQAELHAADNEQLHGQVHLLRLQRSVPKKVRQAIENWAEFVDDSIMLVRVAGQTHEEMVVELPMVRAWLKSLKRRIPTPEHDALRVSEEVRAIIKRWRDMVEKRANSYLDTPSDFIGRMLLDEVRDIDAWLESVRGDGGSLQLS